MISRTPKFHAWSRRFGGPYFILCSAPTRELAKKKAEFKREVATDLAVPKVLPDGQVP